MGNILAPFKKFLSNKNTITIIGVLVGVVVLYFGYMWRVKQSVDPIEIPYANKILTATTKITEDDISFTTVPKNMIKNMQNIVTDQSQIVGKLVSFDSKIAANAFFYSENLIAEEEMPDSIFSNLEDGYTVFDLKIEAEKSYANSIFPGNMIDLYMVTNDDDGKLIFGRFIKSIEVLAVKDESGKNVFENKDKLGTPSDLLFAVPENLFLLLSKATGLGINILPVPRNSSYTTTAAATEITSQELEALIRNKTHIISGECTDLTQCG